MVRVPADQLAGNADDDLVLGCDGGLEGVRESGGGTLQQEHEIPSCRGEWGDVELGGLDDEVAGFGGEYEGEVGGCVDVLDEGGDALGGIEADEVKC